MPHSMTIKRTRHCFPEAWAGDPDSTGVAGCLPGGPIGQGPVASEHVRPWLCFRADAVLGAERDELMVEAASHTEPGELRVAWTSAPVTCS